jgi:hypothetical protein
MALLYGCAHCRALNSQKRRFPTRADFLGARLCPRDVDDEAAAHAELSAFYQWVAFCSAWDLVAAGVPCSRRRPGRRR